jgi:hypothetical protein
VSRTILRVSLSRVPPKVLDPIVGGVPVVVAALHPDRTGTDERFKN